MIDGLHSENDRMVVTCAIMALLKYFSNNTEDTSTCINNVSISGKTITFTRKNGNTIDIVLPINEDEHVTSGTIQGSNLVLKRRVGQDIVIDLSSIIYTGSELDTSGFFTSCSYDAISKKIKFFNKNNVKIGEIDATPFLQDKYLSNIELIGQQVKFTWNQESGKQPFYLNLANFTTDTYIESGSVHGLQNNSPYIELEYNTSRTPIQINLNTLYNNIISQIPFIPGYYKSKTVQTGTFNTLNTEYLGTTWDSDRDKPTATYKYIYKVISKRQYELVASYKIPRPGYFYVVTSGNSIVKYDIPNDNTSFKEDSKKIPGGVVGIIKQGTNGLEIEQLPKYFIYMEPDRNNGTTAISSITYYDIVNNTSNYTITTKDINNNIAVPSTCMFYPSRFARDANNNVIPFKGKHDWLAEGTEGADDQAQDFNDLLLASGYTQLYEMKYDSNNVDNVNIIGDDTHNYDVINGDRLSGLRYVSVRSGIIAIFLGKARYDSTNNVYIAGGQSNGKWIPNSLISYDNPNVEQDDKGYFLFTKIDNWKNKETLEIVWSYIMTNYFNSKDPGGAISKVCYSDATGWFTTWQKFSMINDAYGFVINANAECRDCEVVNPGNGPIPEIGENNMPCSTFVMTFDIQTTTAHMNGTISLNVGGKKWDNTQYPYRYILYSKRYDQPVTIYDDAILFKTMLKDCDFIIQYTDGNDIVSEHITYDSATQTVASQELTSTPNTSSYITDVSQETPEP